MKTNLSVLAIPGEEQRTANPYNYILYAALKENGIKVQRCTLKRLLRAKQFDVVHLNNPERLLADKTLLRVYKNFILFWLEIVWLKASGKKLVWTVRHLFPFKPAHPELAKLFYSLLFRYADGFIAQTKHVANELAKTGIPPEKTAVIPCPHCRGHYPNTIAKKVAREKLGIPPDGFVFLFAGHIRDHKSLIGLIKAFHQMDDKNAVLVIAGKIHFDVSIELEEWIQSDANVLVFPQFIEDEDLQFFYNSADLIVMPDHKTHSFGKALLTLSFNKPMLVSRTENFLELQRQMGGAWVKTFSGSLTENHLKKSKAEVERQGAKQNPDLSFFDRNRIANATRMFYESLLAGGKPLKTATNKNGEATVVLPASKNKAVAQLRVNPVSN